MGVKEEDEKLVNIGRAEGGLKGDSEDEPQWRSSPGLASPLLLLVLPQQPPTQPFGPLLFPRFL